MLMSYPERAEVSSRHYVEMYHLGIFIVISTSIKISQFPKKTWPPNFWDSKMPQDVEIGEKLRKF